jgi:hypothetical protein
LVGCRAVTEFVLPSVRKSHLLVVYVYENRFAEYVYDASTTSEFAKKVDDIRYIVCCVWCLEKRF